MPATFVEGNIRITLSSELLERRPGTRWRGTATATDAATGVPITDVRTMAEHGSAERAEERALLMLRRKLDGWRVAE